MIELTNCKDRRIVKRSKETSSLIADLFSVNGRELAEMNFNKEEGFPLMEYESVFDFDFANGI